MADDAQLEAAVKSTMASLGKLIKKPPMTDKLLRKPPFRFLHDILTEVDRGIPKLWRERGLGSTFRICRLQKLKPKQKKKKGN